MATPSFDATKFHLERVNIYHMVGRTVDFIIPHRYKDLEFLNSGSQGVVASAKDMLTGRRVAIKKFIVSHLSRNARRVAKQYLLMTTLKHPNIINMENVFTTATAIDEFASIYVVTELVSHSLHQVIRSNFIGIERISCMTYQMFCAIRHMHLSGVIHRDLKPTSIVVDQHCNLWIKDFGKPSKPKSLQSDKFTDYYSERYYRAPEKILSIPYDEKVDVWSVGCILAEMITHTVLFKGYHLLDQWRQIATVLGLGKSSDNFINNLPPVIQSYIRAKEASKPKCMEDIFPDVFFTDEAEDPNISADTCRDFLSHVLVIDPKQRYSVDEALNHPFVKMWHTDAEMTSQPSVNRYKDIIKNMKPEDDHDDWTWIRLLFKEVNNFSMSAEVVHGRKCA